MKKTIDESIRAICYFAREYNHEHELTPRQIFINTGYDQFYKKITLENIINVLKNDETIVKDWLIFTEDKRWTPAWGLQSIVKDEYTVFYLEKDGLEKYSINFSNGYYACALMIRMEMEQMRVAGK